MTNPVDEALIAKIGRGEIEMIDPLDYRILELLVEEGTTMSGLYPIGTMVKEVARTLGITSEVVTGRVRYMKLCGYTATVRALGGGKSGKNAWQRTALGDQVLNEWKGKQGGDSGK